MVDIVFFLWMITGSNPQDSNEYKKTLVDLVRKRKYPLPPLFNYLDYCKNEGTKRFVEVSFF